MDFYVLLSSKDSQLLYPENSGNNFRVQLPQELNLSGYWEVAVSDIYINQAEGQPSQRLLVCCDIVDYTIVGDSLRQILRRVSPLDKHFAREQFARVVRNPVRHIHIFILDAQGKPINIRYCDVTLHFRASPL